MFPTDKQDFHANLPTEQDVLDALKASEEKKDVFLNMEEDLDSETSNTKAPAARTRNKKTKKFDDIPVISPEKTTPATTSVTAAKKTSNKSQEKKTVTPANTKNYSRSEFSVSQTRKKVVADKKVQLQAQTLASKALEKKMVDITTLVLDVDGVLTDGSIYVTDDGTGFKRFDSQDGFGIKVLMDNGIQVILLSARKCKATRKRARELGIDEVHLGTKDKKAFLQKYMKNNRLLSAEVAYMGDDLVDLPAMMECGVKIMPANGVAHMSKAMDYTTRAHGGHGAVREVCDTILIAQGLYKQYLDHS